MNKLATIDRSDPATVRSWIVPDRKKAQAEE
jgi:hypothetical protein